MIFNEYIKLTDGYIDNSMQSKWYKKVEEKCRVGREIVDSLSIKEIDDVLYEFNSRIRTEELKAWYGAPDSDALFQGTSVSALTVPAVYSEPLPLETIQDLEQNIADSYIKAHDHHAAAVSGAIIEDVQDWIKEGLFYGVVIASKIISQAFNLSIAADDFAFDVDGVTVDPHEITSYSSEVREKYFKTVVSRIHCFGDVQFLQEELEASLILADISKPKIEKYKSQFLLAPIRCNELATVLSQRVTALIKKKTSGRISPRSLNVVIYDTDTPYTYHQLLGCNTSRIAPILPGLTVLGSSGSIDSFKWLYSYRISLIAQKLQKSSLYSESCSTYLPFVFFGVLVPRDADILLDLGRLGLLRYRGCIDPEIEFLYIFSDIYAFIKESTTNIDLENKIKTKFH